MKRKSGKLPHLLCDFLHGVITMDLLICIRYWQVGIDKMFYEHSMRQSMADGGSKKSKPRIILARLSAAYLFWYFDSPVNSTWQASSTAEIDTALSDTLNMTLCRNIHKYQRMMWNKNQQYQRSFQSADRTIQPHSGSKGTLRVGCRALADRLDEMSGFSFLNINKTL